MFYIRALSELVTYRKMRIRSHKVVNILNGDSHYTEGLYEIALQRRSNVAQYKVLLNSHFDCSSASLSFANYDDSNGQVILSEFCGKTVQSCKSTSLLSKWINRVDYSLSHCQKGSRSYAQNQRDQTV